MAVAVTRDGRPVHIGLYGRASLEHGTPVRRDSVFELASLTKQMTALAVTTLVGEGRLALDARLADYLDDVPPEWTTITVDQLLAHTSGLSHRFEQRVDGVFLTDYSTEEMLASAQATPMVAAPGSDWTYSDQGYFLLGLIVEKVTGQSFAEYMDDTFFAPWGMAQTHVLDQRRIVPNRVEGYALMDGAMVRNRRVWQFGLTSHMGVMSSLDDMVRWEAGLVRGGEAVEATWEIQRTFDTGESCERWGYARGWTTHIVNGRRVLTHGGFTGTAYLRAIDDGVSVIVLTNRDDTDEALHPMAAAWAAAHLVEPSIPSDGLRCWE